jgi:hypothetical protein
MFFMSEREKTATKQQQQKTMRTDNGVMPLLLSLIALSCGATHQQHHLHSIHDG